MRMIKLILTIVFSAFAFVSMGANECADVVLHEWDTDGSRMPKLIKDETGREEYDGTEKPEHLVTWVYDGTSFTSVAKVTDSDRYTIVHDYLGTPTQAYDSRGELVWEMMLDVYGKVMDESHGDRALVPFRYQGQYEDVETGLYYNRFRYYSPQMGMYISSDPIGLAGNNPTLYGYVQDVNTWIDLWGLCGIWNNGWRTPDGKFTTPNSTERAGEKAVKAVKEKLLDEGFIFIGEELTVVNDSGKRRRYDLVFKDSDGSLVGVEVKSNSATKTKSQRLFDAGVTPDLSLIHI